MCSIREQTFVKTAWCTVHLYVIRIVADEPSNHPSKSFTTFIFLMIENLVIVKTQKFGQTIFLGFNQKEHESFCHIFN